MSRGRVGAVLFIALIPFAMLQLKKAADRDMARGVSVESPAGDGAICSAEQIKRNDGAVGYHCIVFIGKKSSSWFIPATGEAQKLWEGEP